MVNSPPWLRPRPSRFPGMPAWGAATSTAPLEELSFAGMPGVDRDWMTAGADGAGVRVCVVDSGVDESHPAVGPLERSASVALDESGRVVVEEDVREDLNGHGTACAVVVRSIAPRVSLSSMRVLTRGKGGSGDALLAGLNWAIEQNFDVINMSLATSAPQFEPALRELADRAYFRRSVLVVAAHNMPVHSFPWTFSSVLSVASHDEDEPTKYYYNGAPPVDFFAKGVRVRVPQADGSERRITGNSLAAPHITGICALALSKWRWMTPFQLKTALYLTADNIASESGGAAKAGHDRKAGRE